MSRITKLAITAALPAALLSFAALSQTADSNAPTATTRPTFFAHLLTKLDTDGDGKISLAEWQAGAATRFNAADTQHAGSVSAQELAASPQAQQHNLRAATFLVRRLDTAKKGYVTAADFAAAAQKRFARLDTQGSGQLTEAQFAAASSHRFGLADTPDAATATANAATSPHAAAHQQYVQDEFAKLDTNHDGVVTTAEYVAAAQAKFAAIDAQGTGQLTAQQIAASPVAQQRDLKFAEHEVSKIGANGAISQAEYLAAAQKRFARIDKNGDGYIEADEFTPHRWARGTLPAATTAQ